MQMEMWDIPKDFSYAIHLLYIPEISYHIYPEDTASLASPDFLDMRRLSTEIVFHLPYLDILYIILN